MRDQAPCAQRRSGGTSPDVADASRHWPVLTRPRLAAFEVFPEGRRTILSRQRSTVEVAVDCALDAVFVRSSAASTFNSGSASRGPSRRSAFESTSRYSRIVSRSIYQVGRTGLDQLARTEHTLSSSAGWTCLPGLRVDLSPRAVTAAAGRPSSIPQ